MMNSTAALDQLFHGFGRQITFVPCIDWNGPHHIFLQLANFFLFIGLFFGSIKIYSIIFLRSMILVGNLLTILWTWLVSCSTDLLLWNLIFAFLNFIHIIILFFKLHPFIRFPHEVEMSYRNLFRPLGVSRYDFQRLYSLTRGIQTLKPKDIYSVENETLLDRLSLLLTGRISVIHNGYTCSIIDSYQFLESPEWFGMNQTDRYQVSFVALEESQLLVWNRDKLKLSISSDRYLQTILDHILGKDIVKKLMLSLDIDLVGQFNDRFSNNNHHQQSEKTKLMQPSPSGFSHPHLRNSNHQILPLNNMKNSSQCFWNLSTLSPTNVVVCNNESSATANESILSQLAANHPNNNYHHPQETTL
uniref:Blood vessel epicardial substance-like n=1 Tax=Dermatophagoides pteronyssinus TaxID=6956 RepID=A0A6P6YH46_DERPT|nr:blood vessel epicardial substance-like [Dermatophagoides pteronyssinus]